ncbi:MAG: GNAT family N-acetyltransferase [Actinobacteria bacterium]|nr:GNAT family N-acetyltransferase [Actinomycetota bacterium]
MGFQISIEDPRTSDVTNLLQSHLEFCQSVTPAESVYALDIEKLTAPEVTVFALRENGELLGVGALRDLEPAHAELKSMHTSVNSRGRGVGKAMVAHILDFARARNIERVSLETGNYEAFLPARKLYESFGFQPCEPFGDYLPSPISICMTKYW